MKEHARTLVQGSCGHCSVHIGFFEECYGFCGVGSGPGKVLWNLSSTMPAADLVAVQEAAQTLLAAAQAELGSGDWCLIRP